METSTDLAVRLWCVLSERLILRRIASWLSAISLLPVLPARFPTLSKSSTFTNVLCKSAMKLRKKCNKDCGHGTQRIACKQYWYAYLLHVQLAVSKTLTAAPSTPTSQIGAHYGIPQLNAVYMFQQTYGRR